MKILITGSNGHIGSYLIIYLFKKDNKVSFYLVDNFLTQRYSSLFNLPRNKKIKFLEGDIQKIDLKKIIKKVDYVIHLAAITNAQESFKNERKVSNNNFNCTKIVADLCLKYKKKLTFISSTSVYGTQKKVVDENFDIYDLQPQSPYALTKLKEENYLKKLAKQNLKVVILRFGTIYGVSIGMRFHTAVNKFCWQASMNQPLTIWKSAFLQMRPYLDLNDASRAISHVIKNIKHDGEVYNILTDNLNVKHIVDIIKSKISNVQIKKVNHKIMNQLSYEVSNKKFLKTGFKFGGSIEKSIDKTIKLIRNVNN